MKTLFLSIVCLALALVSFSQAPESFSYQAVVRNASGVILNNQNVGIRLTILQGAPSGITVYSETFSETSNSFGLVNLQVGTGTTSYNFSSIDWSNGPYYIETAIDVTGGTSYAVMGTSQLLSVPYALYAKTSGSSTPGPQGPQGQSGLSAYQIWLNAGNSGSEADFLASLEGPQGPAGPQGIQGPIGLTGVTGPQGIQGPAGNDGATGSQGPIGLTGPAGPQGVQGPAGADGQSAYQIWLGLGNTGTETDFINSLTGPQGPIGLTGATGAQGPQGVQGPAGQAGLNGTNGANGLSAYETWLGLGNTGTETDFINSLTGPQGPIGLTGATGPQGVQGVQGPIGLTGPQGPAGADGQSAYQIWLGLGNTGTETDFINSLTGPQGPSGNDGPTGPQGIAGIGITSTVNNGNGTYTFNYSDGSSFTTDDLTIPASSSSSTPTGSIIAFVGVSAPTGWMICDGAELDRTVHSSLFSVIGTSFGDGDGTTTFNIPDLRGMFLRGANNGSGNDPNASTRTSLNGGNSGDNVGSYQADEIKSHNHGLVGRSSTGGGGNYPSVTSGGISNIGIPHISATGGAETRPKNISVNYIIKL